MTLKIQPITTEILIDVIKGLISGEYTREEVVQWQRQMNEAFDYYGPGVLQIPLKVNSGYWEYASLAALLTPNELRFEPDEPYLITDHDLSLYVDSLLKREAPQPNPAFKTFNLPLQTKPQTPVRPLVSITDLNLFNRNKLRGIRLLGGLGQIEEMMFIQHQDEYYSFSLHLEHIIGCVVVEGEYKHRVG